MIIIPMQQPQPSRCPNCDRLEDVKLVCRHCGHEYKEDDKPMGWWQIAIATLVVVVMVWLMISTIVWTVKP